MVDETKNDIEQWAQADNSDSDEEHGHLAIAAE